MKKKTTTVSHFQGSKTNLSFLSLAENKLPENNIRDHRGDFLWTGEGRERLIRERNDTESLS